MSTTTRGIADLVPFGDSYRFKMRSPERIVTCRTKEELKQLLDFYSCPLLRNVLPDSPYARRRYVEQVRPALRWYCMQHHMQIPEWLIGNGPYEEYDPQEFALLFGPGEFRTLEFNQAQPEA